MVKALYYGIVASEFKPQSCYYVHFRTNTIRKGMNLLLLLPSMGQMTTLLSFLKDGFGIK